MDQRKIKGLDSWIWAFWGNRPYGRNTNDLADVGAYFIMIIFTAFTVLLFYFLPLKYFTFIILAGFNGFLCCVPISKANQSWWLPLGNLMIGLLGLFFHIRFDLSIFQYHFEQYFWQLYVISGSIAVLRRIWNCLIWKSLDRITLKYGIYSIEVTEPQHTSAGATKGTNR